MSTRLPSLIAAPILSALAFAAPAQAGARSPYTLVDPTVTSGPDTGDEMDVPTADPQPIGTAGTCAGQRTCAADHPSPRSHRRRRPPATATQSHPMSKRLVPVLIVGRVLLTPTDGPPAQARTHLPSRLLAHAVQARIRSPLALRAGAVNGLSTDPADTGLASAPSNPITP